MFFKIKDVPATEFSVYNARSTARRTVILWVKGSVDHKLDRYLLENYDTDLVSTCLKIINAANYSFDYSGNLIINILDKKLDKLAGIITFGNEKVPGSNILKYAFGRDL